MVNGFCETGPLSSRRVGSLTLTVPTLLQGLYDYGVRDFVLVQDAHDASALEFADYPQHNRRHSIEADTVREVRSLPFAEDFTVIPKNSLHPALGTGFDCWLSEHDRLDHAIVVGAGTDLSVYQTAMHLRLRANTLGLPSYRVIVPADAVQTFHISVPIARASGTLSHVGDHFQFTFLYHLALNGVEVVRHLVVGARQS